VLEDDDRPDAETVRAEYDGSEDRWDDIQASNVAPSTAERHADKVSRAYVNRKLVALLQTAQDDIMDGGRATDVMGEVQDRMMDLSQSRADGGRSIQDAVEDTLEWLEEMHGERLTGIPTPFAKLNKLTKGWQEGDLIIPFASTSMGKTAFALHCAQHAAKEGHPVAIFSVEMIERQIVTRLIGAEAGVYMHDIAEREWDDVTRAASRIYELPIHIDDTPSLTVRDIQARLREYIHEHGIQLAVVDYLQEVKATKGDKKHEQVHAVASGLRDLAKATGVPIICPSQTSRGADKRESKRPTLSDLRDAGEEPADMAMSIYRPAYYDISHFEDGTDSHGKAEIAVQKNRTTGRTGRFLAAWRDDVGTFAELDPRDESPF